MTHHPSIRAIALSLLTRIAMVFLLGLVVAALLHRIFPLFLVVSLCASVAAAATMWITLRRSRVERWGLGHEASGLIRWLSVSLVMVLVLLFLTFIPLHVDRSFSVWMLKRVDGTAGGLTVVGAKDLAAEFFSPDSSEIQRRITEQVNLRNLYLVDGYLRLTPTGQFLVHINEVLAKFFHLSPRYALDDN